MSLVEPFLYDKVRQGMYLNKNNRITRLEHALHGLKRNGHSYILYVIV